ncbi:MAG: hypothetical protein A2096_00500 [Spirochaetes bacterium GWF1_41_5]|nr:MAG: hypothetical protein A2096_00500 [Spirochaetes bacterium GWF1_41_5]HBE03432.1 hypothetical protein [Spirochaetia bacterium]
MNFCFVYEELLSASSQPGASERLETYLSLYRENGIKVLISLHKVIKLPDKFKKYFTVYNIPLSENEVPSIEQIDKIVKTAVKHLKKKESVNINCASGIERSGIILVAVLMRFLNKSYHDALKMVSEHRYGVESREIENLLVEYEKLNIEKVKNKV